MHIVAVGLNHKTAPIEIRECLAISNGDLSDRLFALKDLPSIEEGMILSTCNRVEFYGAVRDVDPAVRDLRRFIFQQAPSIPAETIAHHLYYFADHDAVRHVFRVASSLDSMVMGEPQILGQFKEAFHTAVAQQCTGIVLNKFLKKAISVAKKIRTETAIGAQTVSVSYAAVELAKKFFQNLTDHSVLLVGAGEMAKLAAKHLVNHGISQVMITTRDYQRAVDLATQFHGIPIRYESFKHEMIDADIVICSTGAIHPIIHQADMTHVIHRRRNRPVCIIDIAVPRDVEERVRDIDNVYLFNIDDLQQIVDVNVGERQKEALKAEDIVLQEARTMMAWMQSLEAVPTIVALRKKAEDIRRSEVDKILARFPGLSHEEREMVDGLTSSIVNKLLHNPLVTLKDETTSANGTMYVEATRRLFSLDDELTQETPPKG